MSKVLALDTILERQLSDRAIDIASVPWVPQGERVWFKPLRFDLTNGNWVNLLKVKGGGRVNRHRHTGGYIMGYCVAGAWHYQERDWKAVPGTFVYEPPGDVHTLIVEAECEEMQTLFILSGAIQYLDDDDNIVYQDDVFTKLERYLNYCKENSLEPLDLCF